MLYNTKKASKYGNELFQDMYFFYFLAINAPRMCLECFVYKRWAGDKPIRGSVNIHHNSPSLRRIIVLQKHFIRLRQYIAGSHEAYVWVSTMTYILINFTCFTWYNSLKLKNDVFCYILYLFYLKHRCEAQGWLILSHTHTVPVSPEAPVWDSRMMYLVTYCICFTWSTSLRIKNVICCHVLYLFYLKHQFEAQEWRIFLHTVSVTWSIGLRLKNNVFGHRLYLFYLKHQFQAQEWRILWHTVPVLPDATFWGLRTTNLTNITTKQTGQKCCP